MFAAAFITSSLAIRLKRHARQSAQTAFRTRILFDTNQLLQQARERTAIISVTANQLIKLLGKDIVFYPEKRGRLTEPHLFPAAEGEHSGGELLSENEQAVAAWTFQTTSTPVPPPTPSPTPNASIWQCGPAERSTAWWNRHGRRASGFL